MGCEFCQWTVGHDQFCPCNVPELIRCWKRGHADGARGRRSLVATRCLFRAKRKKEAYEIGYREGRRERETFLQRET